MQKNWRTTVIGWLTGIPIILSQIVAVLDSNPETTFSFEAVLAGLAICGVSWFAKDAGQSGTEK